MFSETPSRIVLSIVDANVSQVLEIARELQVAATVIGRTKGARFKVRVNGGVVIDRPVEELESLWRGVLPVALEISSVVAAEEK